MKKLLVLTFIIASSAAYSQQRTPTTAELFQWYQHGVAINQQKALSARTQPQYINNIVIKNGTYNQEETLSPEESKRKFKVQMIAAGVGAAVMGVVGLVMLMGM